MSARNSTSAIHHLVAALRDPVSVATLTGAQWSALLSVARAEVLIGTLAERVAGQPMPARVAALLDAARIAAQQAQTHALWEARMCAVAFPAIKMPVILLKGTAYAAAGLSPASGRQIGDLDILVPRARLAEAEAALLGAGWEWVKDDPYDQAYYRDHMHELPPLIHSARDRMIDVHHTILPLTARPRPNAQLLIDRSEMLPLPRQFPDSCDDWPGEPDLAADTAAVAGLRVLGPFDMVHHCVAHVMADGELDGGLRNLWDFHCLMREMPERTNGKFYHHLKMDALQHGLYPALQRCARLAQHLFGDRETYRWERLTLTDHLYVRRLLARDDWGRETRKFLRLGFTIRGHLLRMPLPMLLRHLWTKWRKSR